MYDSYQDTMDHILKVQDYIDQYTSALHRRSVNHDASKLVSPEKEIFDEFTPKLKDAEYGSEEYQGFLAGMKPALDHHYAMYRHHPEHHANGIHDMNLIDLVEMLADWKAATERMASGDLNKSISINAKRFGYGVEMEALLRRTADYLGWI